MTPAGEFQDPVIHGLGPQLDRGNAVSLQEFEALPVQGIRTGGDPDGCKPPIPYEGDGGLEQGGHFFYRQPGEGTPIKGHLRAPHRVKAIRTDGLLQGFDHRIRCRLQG